MVVRCESAGCGGEQAGHSGVESGEVRRNHGEAGSVPEAGRVPGVGRDVRPL